MHSPKHPKTALIFAMQEEQEGLENHIENKKTTIFGQRRFIEGDLWGTSVVCVLAGIGKVAAAITSTQLIERFGVSELILTGVAGSADQKVYRGDVVIATELLQHDMDASPLFPRYEIPLRGKSKFQTETKLHSLLKKAAEKFSKENQQGSVHQGLIASGDQFIHDAKVLNQLKTALPELLAVEMEGAAIAQVCHDFELPFAVIRTISDSANDDALIDFQEFIKSVAAPYNIGILQTFFDLRKSSI